MKFTEYAVVSQSPKAALIHMFDYHPKKNLIIMISNELFKQFEKLQDVKRVIDNEFERRNSDNYVVYDIYENDQIEKCEYYGRAVFVRICGSWMMSSFNSDFFEYDKPGANEADLIISMK